MAVLRQEKGSTDSRDHLGNQRNLKIPLKCPKLGINVTSSLIWPLVSESFQLLLTTNYRNLFESKGRQPSGESEPENYAVFWSVSKLIFAP